MLSCPKCGFDNELGRIFCHQCGNKLDLNQIKAPTEGAKLRRRVAGRAQRIVRISIELIITCALALGIWMMCVVPEVKRVVPTNAELIGADNKRLELSKLVDGNKPGSVEVTEGELNAFLNSLGFDRPKGAGLEVVPLTVRSDFADGSIKITFHGEIHFGDFAKKELYLAMSGVPTADGNYFEFKPTGGWIGTLPIHPKLLELTDLFQNYFGRVFGRLDEDRRALYKLTSITVTPQKAVLTYQPPAAK